MAEMLVNKAENCRQSGPGPIFKEALIRVYLKTVNTPKQRVFSTRWAPFFLAIRRVFLQKNGFIRR